MIALAPERFTKDLSPTASAGAEPRLVTCVDEAEQAVYVCRRGARAPRAGHRAEASRRCCSAPATTATLLEVELARRNIPFVKYGGLKFLEAAHVKDCLAVLRVCENPRDEVSWFRVLQLLDGVGPATARRRDLAPPRRTASV